MFKAIQKMKIRKDRGFTLVELLIVVAIIGILAAIAIPQFGAYRRRGYNASANSDLRNIRTTEEAMQADFQDYGASNLATGGAGAQMSSTLTLSPGKTTSTAQTVALSPNVVATVITAENAAGTARTNYVGKSAHSSGDSYYGIESDDSRVWRYGFAPGGIPDTAAFAPTASTGNPTDLSASNWQQM